ncbi:MAG TPA: class B sortase, partial [Bacillota bacterium]|nr:class B sortase [Bacillota bacterium]
KTFSGEEALTGSIFLDYRNDLKNSDEKNFIVYGHRVSDGSMFEHLTKYLDEDFFESHRTFTFDTLYDEYEAEVFAVYNTMIDFNYIETDFETDNEFELMLNEFKDRSIYDVDVDVSKDDQILTLSTCEYTLHPDDSRLVVQAKLTKK